MTDLDPHKVNHIPEEGGGDPRFGTVRTDPGAIFWNGGMFAVVLVAGPATLSIPSAALFFGSTGLVLLLGHSVGYHRLFIHGSFATPRWLERMLVWFGALVGMAGPFGIVRTHDLRDWAQRQSDCHPYFSHRSTPLRDAWWQIYCRFDLVQPPLFDLGRKETDPFYRWLEVTWRWQQLPVAVLFFALGGWAWVVWGVAARVAVANHGHWLVGHLAHRQGPQSWLVDGAGVQAHNVPWAAIPTMGEAWHNNHHAWPGSARMGLYPGQFDWGWCFIRLLERAGLAWNVRTPETMVQRENLTAASAVTEPAPCPPPSPASLDNPACSAAPGSPSAAGRSGRSGRRSGGGS